MERTKPSNHGLNDPSAAQFSFPSQARTSELGSNSKAEQETVFLNFTSLSQEEWRVLKWRQNTRCAIFKVEIRNKRSSNLQQISYEKPFRFLHHLKPLQIENLMYFLKSIVITLQVLVEKFGFFHILDAMVALTERNQCRIWINQNYQKNHVSQECNTQEQMIQDLLGIFERVADQDNSLIIKLFKKLREEKSCFVKIIEVLWRFSYDQRIIIPRDFQKEVVKKEKKSSIRKSQDGLQFRKPKHKRIKFHSTLGDENSDSTSQKNNYLGTGHYNGGFLKVEQIKRISLDDGEEIKMFENTFNSMTTTETFFGNIKLEDKRDNYLLNNAFKSQKLFFKHRKAKMIAVSPNNTQQSEEQSFKDDSSDPNFKFKEETMRNVSQKIEFNSLLQNTMKMKDHIHEKIKRNQEKKRKTIGNLQEVGTVKSIGDFTESEKRMKENMGEGYDLSDEFELLGSLGRKIEISKFFVDEEDFEDQIIHDDQKKKLDIKNPKHRKRNSIFKKQ